MPDGLTVDYDLAAIGQAADKLIAFIGTTRIVLFDAQMGAGKTTLIKTIVQQLGSADTASSPTFSIVNEYVTSAGKIFHFDLYRIKNERELFDIGFEEYVDSGDLCLIEWPELARPFLQGQVIDVKIGVTEMGRTLTAARLS